MLGCIAFNKTEKFLEWCVLHGLDVGPGGSTGEDFTDAFLQNLMDIESRISAIERGKGESHLTPIGKAHGYVYGGNESWTKKRVDK